MQPTADCGVAPKGSRGTVHREQGVLECVLGLLGAGAAQPGQPVQCRAVAAEQSLEGDAVAGGVGGQQFGVAEALRIRHGPDSSQREAARHFTFRMRRAR